METAVPILYVNHTSAVSGAEESLLALMSGATVVMCER